MRVVFVFANHLCPTMLAIPHLRIFWRFSMFLVFLLVLYRSHYFWNTETIVHTYIATKHVHHKLFEVIGMIKQQFSSNQNKKLMLSANAFVRYKFRHIEHNNTTLCMHFSDLSLVYIWHLSMTQQNGAVSNRYSTNCSSAPSVVWNPHFILVHLVNHFTNPIFLRYLTTIANKLSWVNELIINLCSRTIWDCQRWEKHKQWVCGTI